MKTWTLSYPRSGVTYTRYMIEYLTQKPTKDAMAVKIVSREQKAMIHEGDDYVAYKTHFFANISHNDRLIFVLRNPKECLVRHNKGKRELNKEFFVKQVSNEDGTYCGLLKFFEEHDGEKMLIYYEDLIKAPILQMSRLKEFFNVGDKMFDEYLKDPEKLSENALKCYPKSQTKGKSLNHHSKELSRWVKIALDNLIKKQQPVLWDKYLSRYAEIRHN